MSERADAPSPAESRESSPLSSVPESVEEKIRSTAKPNAQNATTLSPTPVQSSGEQPTADAGGTGLLDKERALEKKYGSLYAADEEKERRKFRFHAQYARFLEDSKMHQMKAEHLATRNKIWADGKERNAAEIEKCKARIEELEVQSETMQAAEEQMNEEFAEDVEAWEDDQATVKKYEAYFSLESDELDL
ncbi:hypothetical protein LTR85_008076 [Meristemomyces frigidus]|nr:hypothetical protein LTR85_008076 [Meristemomyces frigidus]